LKVTRKHGAELHPALGTADWSRTGVFGHSAGAKYALPAANNNHTDLNISAVLLSSQVPHHQYSPTMPIMITTGSLDKANHNWTLTDYFENLTTTPKVYASLRGAFHMEVQEGERLNLLTSQFMSCHVGAVEEDCDVIYKSSNESLCNINNYEACLVCTELPCHLPSHPPVPEYDSMLLAGDFDGEDSHGMAQVLVCVRTCILVCGCGLHARCTLQSGG